MTHILHDPKIHALPYPENLMHAIAKADLIDPETKALKPPVIELNSNLEEFITTVPLVHNLSNYEAKVITYHYESGLSLADIAYMFECTSENIRSHRNHALNLLLKAYLEWSATLESQIISEIKRRLDHTTLECKPGLPSVPKLIKPAKNSIKKQASRHRKPKCQIPYKFYIRLDGVLYVELKEETNLHYIGEFYSYSNSNFSIEGIVVDISIAGILLTDWEVKRK